ncbi:cytochrome P450 [Streptomyces sp. NRRL S-87]|uniref:cytochrome P450 n=1 Tax=Streptomyces sp. NRRL S-87 TaxID=1463920 RepID=UPI0004C0A773|nr:cytochrome P450 [Streptomyces sp. NRRL S-87]
MSTASVKGGVPLAGGALPVLGHGLALARDPFGFLSSLPAYGELVRIRLGPQDVVMTCGPELTRAMLLDDRTFDKGGPFYERAREASGDGLVTCPHRLHRRQRRLCQPAFHEVRFPAYTEAMVASAVELVSSWRDGEVIDVNDAMVTLTMRAMVKAMFATQLSAELDRQVVDDLAVATGGIFRRMLTPPRLSRIPTPGNRRYNASQARLRTTVAEAITSRRADLADHGGLLSVLLSSQDEESETASGPAALSDTEVAEQVLTFFLAGAETTANLLAWIVYELGRAPALQERLHAQTVDALGGRPPSYDLLPVLTSADHATTEALRMYPPAWFLTRTASRDADLGGVRLPAGTTLGYSAYLIHRRPDLYPDPDRFDPDRWEGRKPDRTAYIPFGAGARKCIGDRFAHIQAVLSLAVMTAGWRFAPVTDRVPRAAVHATLMPGGLRMRVLSRT